MVSAFKLGRFHPSLIWAIALAALWASNDARAERTIIVYAGTPRGGAGDIAANLVMARRLQEARPQDKIVIAVDLDSHLTVFPEGEPIGWSHWKNTREILTALAPGFNFKKGRQQLQGLTFINSRTEKLPNADYVVGYSMNAPIPQQIRGAAPISIGFSEPGSSSDATVYREGGTMRVEFDAGFSRSPLQGSLGGYLRISPSTPPLSREELEARLAKKGVSGLIPALFRQNPYQGRKLAFAYAQRDSEIQKYLAALGAVASRNPNEKYVAIIKDSAKVDKTGLPVNLQVAALKMDLVESEAAIAHADVPILVTGDVSRDFAIEYGKAFAFEGNADTKLGPFHKVAVMETLQDQMRKTSVGDPENATAKGRGIVCRLLSCEQLPGTTRPGSASQSDLEELIENPELQKNMIQALQEVRQGRSLVGATLWSFDVLDHAKGMREDAVATLLMKSGLLTDFSSETKHGNEAVQKIIQKNPTSVGCVYYLSVLSR